MCLQQQLMEHTKKVFPSLSWKSMEKEREKSKENYCKAFLITRKHKNDFS